MIYIIDDDKYVVRGFQILLKSTGLEAMGYIDAEDFLQSWDPCENDILIVDIHMPGMNGCELLDKLEEHKLYLPVIIITAFDEEESRRRSEAYGAIAYLTKPVDSDKLLDLIKDQISKSLKQALY